MEFPRRPLVLGSWSRWSYMVLADELLTLHEVNERLICEWLFVQAGLPRREPPN